MGWVQTISTLEVSQSSFFRLPLVTSCIHSFYGQKCPSFQLSYVTFLYVACHSPVLMCCSLCIVEWLVLDCEDEWPMSSVYFFAVVEPPPGHFLSWGCEGSWNHFRLALRLELECSRM